MYDATMKTARMQATASQLDNGTGNAALHILDATNNVLVSFGLLKPAASVTNDILTLLGMPMTVTASLTGVAASAVIDDGVPLARVALTVGVAGSGAQVILDNLNIAQGQSVKLSSATIQHAA